MEIKALKNGPYLIPGPVVVVDENGQEHTMEGKTVALCRCGRSANKPFCDGSHKKDAGFEAEEVVLRLGQ